MTIADQEELARVKTELAAAVSNGDTALAAQLEGRLSGLPVVDEPVEANEETGEEKPARPSRKQATSRPRRAKETRS